MVRHGLVQQGELLFNEIACTKCNRVLIPTEDEIKGDWVYPICCFCGTKQSPLHLIKQSPHEGGQAMNHTVSTLPQIRECL